MDKKSLFSAALLAFATLPIMAGSQATTSSKAISKNLFGIFFEDLNYAADGGLYAELVQNRSFEYTPSDLDAHKQPKGGWYYFSGWDFLKWGNTIATLSLESKSPIHPNNPHYLEVNVKTVRGKGPGIRNHGYDGMVIKKDATYRFSVFMKNIVKKPTGNWQDDWTLNPKDGNAMERSSCVQDFKTGDIILKMSNIGAAQQVNIDLSAFKRIKSKAIISVLKGDLEASNYPRTGKGGHSFEEKNTFQAKKKFTYTMPENSFTVIRIKTK